MSSFFRKKKGGFNVSSQNICRKTNEEDIQQPVSPKRCIAWRYVIGALAFMAGFMINHERLSLAIALVSMVKFTSNSTTFQNRTPLASCSLIYNTTEDTTKQQMGGEFDWSPELQGLILGAGFFGYGLTPILGGSLAQMLGAKRTILGGNSVAALAMLVSPIASSWHSYALIVSQLLRGVAQGFVLPSTYLMMANWSPRRERGFLSSLIFTGLYSGVMVGGAMAGFLCDIEHLGWRSAFYFSGAIGLLFSIVFAQIFYEKPSDHPWISKEELKYITDDQDGNENKKRLAVPWRRMFTSVSTYGLLAGMFGQYWSVSYFTSVHPVYLATILHYPISKNGLLSSLPFLLMILGTVLTSSTSDWLYRRKYIGVDKLRKGCNFFGCLIFTLAIFGVYAVGCNALLNNAFFAIAVLSCGISTPGSRIAAVDMTPNFTATLMGVLGMVCNQTGFIISVVTGYLTKDQSLEGWKTVFLLNITVVMSSGIVFAVFGSANVQPWNFASDSNDEKRRSREEGDFSRKTEGAHIAPSNTPNRDN